MFTLDINESVSLALVQPSFAGRYLAIVEAERDYLSEWLAWPPHADSEEFFLRFIRGALHDYADGKSMTCAVLYQGVVVGNVSYNSICRNLGKAEIGYWLSKEYQGRGIMTTAVRYLIDDAFNRLKLHKVQISAAAENEPSRALCERLHMTLEGIIRNSENLNGRVVDHAVYGIQSAQWLALTAAET
jgi:ribosomal-protein-serine acetyltransferase